MSLLFKDFYTWTQEQASAIRARRWDALDVAVLAEEVEDMGKADKHAIRSHFIRLIEHLLKLKYVDAPNDLRGWRVSVVDAKDEIMNLVEESPSLSGFPEEILSRAYQSAKKRVELQYDIVLPNTCPWTVEEVLYT